MSTEACTIRILMPMDEFPPPNDHIRRDLMSTNLMCIAQERMPNQKPHSEQPTAEMVKLVTDMMDDLLRTMHFGESLVINDISTLPEQLQTDEADAVVCVEGSLESSRDHREIHAMMLLNYFADCARRGVYGYEHPLGLIWVHPDGEFHTYCRNGDVISGGNDS